jgi:hypothetical protein
MRKQPVYQITPRSTSLHDASLTEVGAGRVRRHTPLNAHTTGFYRSMAVKFFVKISGIGLDKPVLLLYEWRFHRK